MGDQQWRAQRREPFERRSNARKPGGAIDRLLALGDEGGKRFTVGKAQQEVGMVAGPSGLSLDHRQLDTRARLERAESVLEEAELVVADWHVQIISLFMFREQ